MFWKKKEFPKEHSMNECENESNSSDCPIITLTRELKHTKSIIDGKLYDTQKSTFISNSIDGRLLFITQKGNYFSCIAEQDTYIRVIENECFPTSTTVYLDIRPETIEYAKANIGKYEPEKYIELFGDAEEA